jgi:hypothetical protein
MTIQERIIEIVENKQAIKGTELAVILATEFLDVDNVTEIIETLVKNGEIVELEYSLPNMNYRIKSIYFPKGTQYE